MAPVFGHGRLRLYLLKLLHEFPRHGYEVIRLLEERFQGLYSPSAGTVYPRLAKLAAEGLVAHTEEGGRKVYSLTEQGERELAAREDELALLEREIRESLAALAANVREDVSGSARSLREELGRAADAAAGEGGNGARSGGGEKAGPGGRAGGPRPGPGRGGGRFGPPWAHVPHPGHEETVRAAAEHFERAARRIQEQVRSRASAGDWQTALREGMEGLSEEIGGFTRLVGTAWPTGGGPGEEPDAAGERAGRDGTAEPERPDEQPDERPADGPRAAREEPAADARRELERLLDRFRDEVRDAARDHGVTPGQLRTARRRLSAAAAHLTALLRDPDAYREGTGES